MVPVAAQAAEMIRTTQDKTSGLIFLIGDLPYLLVRRNSSTALLNSAAFSIMGAWPHASKMICREMAA
jgi:hypothetical protein